MMNDAIILGGDHHNTLGVIRSLGRKGLRPFLMLLADGPVYVSRSRYLSGTIVLRTPEEILSRLLETGRSARSKPVIFCCHDGLSSLLDLNRDELSRYFHLPGSGCQGTVTKLMDKSRMSALALSCGLNIPQTYSPEDCRFPCIVKPLASICGSKDDIVVCNDNDSLEKYFASHGRDRVLIQQLIDKSNEFQLIGCVLKDGRAVIPGYSDILRPCKGSNTSFLRYDPMPEGMFDMEAVLKFLAATGYTGLFSIELLRDKSGKDYFMEMNFRNDGNAICVTDAGVNLPFIWYLSCTDGNVEEELGRTVRGIYVIPEFEELSLLANHTLTFKEFLSDFRLADSHMEYAADDIRPFFSLLGRRVKKKLSGRLEILKRHRWDLAFVDKDWNFSFVSELPDDRWFADPFILDVTENEIILLAEEYEYKIGKGRIAKVVIDRSGLRFKSFSILLELPTHLSFPSICRAGGKIFVYPENSQSGHSSLYALNEDGTSLEFISVLSEEPLTDAVMCSYEGHRLLFSTSLPEPNGNVLHVLEADDASGRYNVICALTLDERTARNAGAILERDNMMIRPAQICKGKYGYGLGISFQSISGDVSNLHFDEIERRLPPRGYNGMHTFNSYKGFSVVDCRRFIHPHLRGILHFMKHGLKE